MVLMKIILRIKKKLIYVGVQKMQGIKYIMLGYQRFII